MVSSTEATTGTTRYTYRPNGMRQAKIGAAITTHVWDGANIVADIEGSSVTAYIRGVNLIASVKGSTKNYFLYNAHGDVVLFGGKAYKYDAFGNELTANANDVNPFRYAGEYWDEETGSYYLRARYYEPETGRFLSEDPIRDRLNYYTYCGANPVAFIDPFGLAFIPLRITVENEGGSITWDGETRRAYVSINGIWGLQYYVGDGKGSYIDPRDNRMYVWDETYYSDTILTDKDRKAGVTIKMIGGKPYRNVTKPVDTALGKVVAEAEQLVKETTNAALSYRGGATMGMVKNAFWFLDQVNHSKPWDIKREMPWEQTIGSTFPGSYDAQIYYQGRITTLEELGNYTYGYIGGAVGFNAEILYAGSWVAAGRPLGGEAWANEYNDWNAIKMGYDAYLSIA